MKGNKGITLIALVVTIIVLIILAGVAIAMLRGDNGILSNANKAGKDTSIASAKEEIALAINEGITDYYQSVYAAGTPATIADKVNTKLNAVVTKINAENKAVTVTYATPMSASDNGSITIKYNGDNDTYTGTITKGTAALSWDK